MAIVARESFHWLGFILRDAYNFKTERVVRFLYNLLVCTKLETNSGLLKLRNSFWGAWLQLLENQKDKYTVCKVFRGVIGALDLHTKLARFFIPNNYRQYWRHCLPCLSPARFHTVIYIPCFWNIWI